MNSKQFQYKGHIIQLSLKHYWGRVEKEPYYVTNLQGNETRFLDWHENLLDAFLAIDNVVENNPED